MKLLGVFLFFSIFAHGVQAQELITGIVVDSATFAPLPFVSVRVKNQNKGATTDTQGNFRIMASRQDTLQFSFVGYKSLDVPLHDWEPSMLLLAEHITMLNDVTITGTRMDPYQGMFDEQNDALKDASRKLPFYYSKTKKQKIKLNNLYNENVRVQTYVDAVVKNEDLKKSLMLKYSLTENEYYRVMENFNSTHYTIMYYITAGELISLINNFFAQHASKN